MPDILLIQPPIRDFYLTRKRTVPYGLACIAAALIQKGFSVSILDALATSKSRRLEWPREMGYLKPYYGKPDTSPFSLFHHYRHFGYSFEHIGRLVRESGAFLIGISALFTPYAGEALKTADIVKQVRPESKTVLGGHHPSALPADVLEHPSVDFVIRGDGEPAMPALAEVLKSGADVSTVPGLAYRHPNRTITMNPPAIMENLSTYPPPAVQLINRSYYRRNRVVGAVVVGSRGCPMNCSYCTLGKASLFPYRRRPVESVLNEIENSVHPEKTGFIDFEDENLSLDREWFLYLLQAIQSRYGRHAFELRAMNGLYPPSLDEEMVAHMQKAGFKILNLSLGSISLTQLKRFQRPNVRPALEKCLLWAEKYGLKATVYIIAGAPFQSASHSVSDLLYLAGRRALAGVSIFYPAPGSADFNLCRKLALLPESHALMRSSTIPLSHLTSRKAAVTILRLGRILNFMKSIADRDNRLPDPRPYTQAADHCFETERQLLEWFLYDGKIRGRTPQGEIFQHQIDLDLTRRFIHGLKSIKLHGIE